MAIAKFEGVRLILGDRQYIVPAMTLRQLRNYKATLDKFSNQSFDPTEEDLDDVVGVVHAVLQRNYPELKADEVADLVDINSLKRLLPAICGVSGLEVVPSGEDDAAGSTGTSSTLKLQPSQAGDSQT